MNEWRSYPAIADGKRHTVVGTVMWLSAVHSPQLCNQRDLLVYLPPAYATGSRRYPVIYMHDGQNLFDEASSYAGEWQVDEAMQALSQEGLEAIVIGIPNMGQRRVAEYTPLRIPHTRTGHGAAYISFLVDTVKPLIDRDWRTQPERQHTAIMGSSLGGLISLYAVLCRPDVFGLAGVMSPAFTPSLEAILGLLPQPAQPTGRIYLDVGTREGHSGARETARGRAESAQYLADARALYRWLLQIGYRAGADVAYVEETGAIHHESAWARRLPAALRFLLQGIPPQ